MILKVTLESQTREYKALRMCVIIYEVCFNLIVDHYIIIICEASLQNGPYVAEIEMPKIWFETQKNVIIPISQAIYNSS